MKALVVILGAVCLLVVAALLVHHVFIDTLSLSEVLPPSEDNVLHALALAAYDPDTGLTRYQVYRLEGKCQGWAERLSGIDRMPNGAAREAEYQKLTVEMLQDPTVKRLVQKGLGGAAEGALELLRLIGR